MGLGQLDLGQSQAFELVRGFEGEQGFEGIQNWRWHLLVAQGQRLSDTLPGAPSKEGRHLVGSEAARVHTRVGSATLRVKTGQVKQTGLLWAWGPLGGSLVVEVEAAVAWDGLFDQRPCCIRISFSLRIPWGVSTVMPLPRLRDL